MHPRSLLPATHVLAGDAGWRVNTSHWYSLSQSSKEKQTKCTSNLGQFNSIHGFAHIVAEQAHLPQCGLGTNSIPTFFISSKVSFSTIPGWYIWHTDVNRNNWLLPEKKKLLFKYKLELRNSKRSIPTATVPAGRCHQNCEIKELPWASGHAVWRVPFFKQRVWSCLWGLQKGGSQGKKRDFSHNSMVAIFSSQAFFMRRCGKH